MTTQSTNEISNRVLDYWFAGDLKTNYNSKWFPSGSKDQQSVTDRNVAEEFSDLLSIYLREDWTIEEMTPQDSLAQIIVLDQFSRHIFRFREEPEDSTRRQEADRRALLLCECIIGDIEESNDQFWDSGFSVSEMVFAMMPFR